MCDSSDDSQDFKAEYVYGLAGNRLGCEVNDTDVTGYEYDDNDRLTLESCGDANTFYYYDDNGSLVAEANDSETLRTYGYNLQGRLAWVSYDSTTVDYTYNPDGIRVRAAVAGGATTDYLIDAHNHTGYAQVFKQTTGATRTVYASGLDVLAQATGTSAPQYLLYDGHGSTRQLADAAGNVTESYSYDAYGNLRNSGSPSTNLLYTGEFYDSHLSQYYLRARWYSPATGRFNRIDPFSGSSRDPQSLHKYLYAHCNPVNNLDPGGTFTLVGALQVIGKVMSVITVATFSYRAGGVLYKLTSGEEQLVDEAFLEAEDLVKDLAVEAALVVATFGLVKFVQKGLSLFKGAKKAAAIARFKRNIKYGAKAERYVLGKIGGKKAFKTSLGTVIPDQVTKSSIKEVKNV